MYMKFTKLLTAVLVLAANHLCFSQSGGTYITVKDDDINTGMQAASLLNSEMNKALTFGGVSYADGIKFGNVAFAKHYDKIGTFLASMNYAGYGQFIETDEFGTVIGTFKASDYALTFGYGKELNKYFSYGGAIKFLYSDYYIANSFGIAADLSATQGGSISPQRLQKNADR